MEDKVYIWLLLLSLCLWLLCIYTYFELKDIRGEMKHVEYLRDIKEMYKK